MPLGNVSGSATRLPCGTRKGSQDQTRVLHGKRSSVRVAERGEPQLRSDASVDGGHVELSKQCAIGRHPTQFEWYMRVIR